MKTLFLQFPNESAAAPVLEPLKGVGLYIDVVGVIWAPTGQVVDERPELLPLPGWHVNVLATKLPEALQPFEIFPVTPARVFAVESESLRVPQEVTMGQCRLALFDCHGIETDDKFLALVGQLPEERRARALLELRTRPTVRRDNPLVQALGQAMDWDLDALFLYARGL